MKSNNLLTYLLYALLAALILAAGYKACQMQKEKQKKAQEQAEWEATIKKLYPEGDSTATGSSYVSRDSTAPTTTTPTTTKPTSPQTGGSTTTTKPTTTKPSTTTTDASKTTTTTKGSTTVKGVGSGKWEVRAGTFQYMEGARDQLEKVIRMGYTNAEIKKTSNGWAAVIVLRTNDKNKAIQVVDQLEKRGVDAAVFKR